jgi:hypothetical protein
VDIAIFAIGYRLIFQWAKLYSNLFRHLLKLSSLNTKHLPSLFLTILIEKSPKIWYNTSQTEKCDNEN